MFNDQCLMFKDLKIMKTNYTIQNFAKRLAMIVTVVMTVVNGWGYTVTFSTGVGNSPVDAIAESYNNEGITIPDGVTPAASGWEFVGWAESSCSETTKAPELLLPGNEYEPQQNRTLFAVYRKYTSGTSTAEFSADDDGTNIQASAIWPARDWIHKGSGIELYLRAGQWYTHISNPNTWTVTKSQDQWNYAFINAHRKIRKIEVTLSESTYKILDDGTGIETDNDKYDGDDIEEYAASLSTDGTSQVVTCEGYVDGDVTKVWLFSTESQQIRMRTFTVTYYNAKFNSNPCDNLVTVSSGSSSSYGTLSITGSPVATCSSTASDRRVTISVTPTAGYTAPSALTLTSSTGTVHSTKHDGPTANGTKWDFIYEYDEDDSGTATYDVTCIPASYSVTLNDNSGSGGSGSKTVTYLSNTNLTTSVTVPTRTHYIFGGYWTSSDGGSSFTTQLINADGSWKASVAGYTDASKNWQGTSDLTLYAKWTEHTYTNYRTQCCDDPALAFDGEYNYQTLVRQDIHGAHGGDGSATVEQGKATLVLDYSTESSGTCTVEVKKLTGGDNRSTAAAGSSCSSYTTIAVDGTNKKVTFEIWTYAASYPTANGQGTYRIKLSQAAASTYCATDVYYFVDVTLRDKFVDAVNGNSTIYVDGQSKSSTDYYKTPAESDMDADLNDDCNSTTRRLIGWIKETDLQTMYGSPGETGYLEDAASYNASKVVAPYADFTTSGCTWYAVWGVDNTPEP